MIALIALALAAPQDAPAMTPAATEALSRFGDIVRESAETGATRVFASAGCGNGWSAYALQWQRPSDTGPRRWGPPAKPPKPDAPLPDANVIAATGDLCDSFQAQLTEDQYFEVDWSIKDGVVTSSVEAVKDLNNTNWEGDVQKHATAFFGTSQATAVPRKSRR
jgi:hypothetical protein